MDAIRREHGGTITWVERQKADGTWQVWHVAQWKGEERHFTTYAAAHRWLIGKEKSEFIARAQEWT